VTGATDFLILADESAAWRIAGLSQLDRLVLALNELAESHSPNEIINAIIFWRPDIPSAQRWLPRHPRISRVRLSEAVRSTLPGARILHTRLFVERNGLAKFLETASAVTTDACPEETNEAFHELTVKFKAALPPEPRRNGYRYVNDSADAAECTDQCLRRGGKSQDGVVSRYLNRPLSRFVSRYLLQFDVTPTRWTVTLFVLPVAAFFCLARGDYFGIVAGAFLFQLYSVLDGCDGEIARATYQESERGGRIDDFLDMVGSILFVIGLGVGLFRSISSIYLLEGVVCAAVIATTEWFLRRVKTANRPKSQKLTDALYPRHHRLFNHPALGMIRDHHWWWIVQFTKRDFAILLFLGLALVGAPQWILHLWLTVSTVTLVLSARPGAGKSGASQPGE